MKLLLVNLSVLFMFISGVFLIDILSIPWSFVRIIEFFHSFSSIFLTIFIIFPFLFLHIKSSWYHSKRKSLSGTLFGITFLLLVCSGLYLLFIGNRGGDIFGEIAYNIHLYGSFVLITSLLFHLKTWIVKVPILQTITLLIVFIPMQTYAYSHKLTNIKLKDGVSRYHNNDWKNSATCKKCHPEIFKQWANSNHRHMADSNPYYMVLENLAEMDKGKEFRQWCMGCHNPSAVTTKRRETTHFMHENIMPDPLFVKDSQTLIQTYKKDPKRLEQGVSCIACHRITDANATGNSSYTLDLTKRKKYLFEDSTTPTKTWINNALINAKPKIHKQEYLNPVYKKSRYCASCHNEFLPHSGKKVVSTYDQWEKSPYNNPNDPKKHKECIDCHMSYIEDGKYIAQIGRSTVGGKIKKDIKTHYFTGGNHFLSGLKSEVHQQQSIELLKTAATLDLNISHNKLLIGVTNSGAGHKLPTGAADFRELWLDITVTDKNGHTLLSSGKLDKDGNIEPNSIIYNKVFGDKDGNPVGLLFWRYEKLLKDTRIPAGKRVQEEFILPKDANYPLKVKVKLNFRIYPQWVTDIVKVAYPALPDPPVITIKEMEKCFD